MKDSNTALKKGYKYRATHQRDLNAARNLEIYLRAKLKNWNNDAKIMLADRYTSVS